MDVIDRIAEFMATNKLNATQLAKLINIPQTTVGDQMRRVKKGVSYALVDAIATKYPELSMEWLIRGEGEMYGRPQPKSSQDQELAEVQRKLFLSEQVIQMKERQISDLQFQLAEKKDFVSSVKGVVKELARSAAHGCHTEEEQGIFKK